MLYRILQLTSALLLTLQHLLFSIIILLFSYLLLKELEYPELTEIFALVLVFGTLFLMLLILISPFPRPYSLSKGFFGKFRGLTVILLACFFVFQLIDIQPKPPRYSITEVKTEDRQLQKTGQLLRSLWEADVLKGSELLDLRTKNVLDDLAKDHQLILKSWDSMDDAKKIIDQLSIYSTVLHQYPVNDEDLLPYNKVRPIATAYQLYSLLNGQLLNYEEAILQLSTIHKVSRLGLEGSVTLVQKMIWAAIIKENLETAYQLVQESFLDDDQLSRLLNTFTPLTDQELSLYKPWVGEYLALRKSVDQSGSMYIQRNYLDFQEFFPTPVLFEDAKPWMLDFFYAVTLQRNRTKDKIDDFWQKIIEQSKDFSATGSSNWQYEEMRYPPLRNLAGWYFHKPPTFAAYGKRLVDIKQQSMELHTLISAKNRVDN